MLQQALAPIKEQTEAINGKIEEQQVEATRLKISEDLIRQTVENFRDEIQDADPNIKKRALRALLDKVILHPKTGETQERILEVKGIYLPLTRDFLVTPTGLEPVLPA